MYIPVLFLFSFVAFFKGSLQEEQNLEENDLDFNFEDLKETEVIPPTNEPLEFLPAPRIVSGSSAFDGQFPYQVSLRENGGHICGGSIISENYILTAAHCVTRNFGRLTLLTPARYLSVRAGSNQVNSGGVVAQIAQVKAHPGYRNLDNDIALVKLVRPLTFNNRIKPIALGNIPVPSGASVVTSGWGRIGPRSDLAQRLQYVALTALSTEQCRRNYASVTDAFLCLAPNRNAGVCYGDSGGPAVYQNRLVGVTNFVIGTCGRNVPDGYARVSSFLPWIWLNSDAKVESESGV